MINEVTKYAPHLYLDEKEPFSPKKVGYTIHTKNQDSKSSKHKLKFNGKIRKIIEYAIYWDYDIQHLYDLEHVWIYIDKDGKVIDAMASFHGDNFRALLRDNSNLDDTHLRLYAQPGKHGFMPKAEYLYLKPDLFTACSSEAGDGGFLLANDIIKGRMQKEEGIDELVEKYIKDHYAFEPTMQFNKYLFQDDMFVSWEELEELIPQYLEVELAKIKSEYE